MLQTSPNELKHHPVHSTALDEIRAVMTSFSDVVDAIEDRSGRAPVLNLHALGAENSEPIAFDDAERHRAAAILRSIPGAEDAIDGLAAEPPLAAVDSPAVRARELRHRYAVWRLAAGGWRDFQMMMHGGLLVFAGIALLVLWPICALALREALILMHPQAPWGLGSSWTIFTASPWMSAVVLAAIMGGSAVGAANLAVRLWLWRMGRIVERAASEADDLVERVWLRRQRADVPPDVVSPWRRGTMPGGRPEAAEVTADDYAAEWGVLLARQARTLRRRYAAVAAFPPLALLYLGQIVFGGRSVPSPAEIRAEMLERAREAVPEVGAWADSGGTNYALALEEAIAQQEREAARDASAFIRLGEATGILAARGDHLAPEAGRPIGLTLLDLRRHLLVTGAIGSGKTSMVARQVLAQIGQLPAGRRPGLVVADGKGALAVESRDLVRDMVVIDPAHVTLSLTGDLSPALLASTVADLYRPKPGEGGEGGSFYWGMASDLLRSAATIAFACEQRSLADVLEIALQARVPAGEGFLLSDEQRRDPLVSQAIHFLESLTGTAEQKADPKVRSNTIQTLRNWVSPLLSDRELFRMVEAEEDGPGASLDIPLEGGAIGLQAPAFRYGEGGRLIVSLLCARLMQKIRTRAERKWEADGEAPVVFVVDEAQAVATSNDVDMLAMGRSLGLGYVALTQNVEGVLAQLGEEKGRQYLGIFGSYIGLANASEPTEEFSSRRVGSALRCMATQVVGGYRSALAEPLARSGAGAGAAAATQPALSGGVRLASTPGLFTRIFGGVLSSNESQPDLVFNRPGMRAQSTVAIGMKPLIETAEMRIITAAPNTGVCALVRARVPVRDIVRMSPRY